MMSFFKEKHRTSSEGEGRSLLPSPISRQATHQSHGTITRVTAQSKESRHDLFNLMRIYKYEGIDV